MKIQVMAAKISAWGFFWTLFPMPLSVFCYLFILTPFAKLSPKLNHISDKKATTPGVPKRSPIQVLTRPYVV